MTLEQLLSSGLLGALLGSQPAATKDCGCGGSPSPGPGTRMSLVAQTAGTLDGGATLAASRRLEVDFSTLAFDAAAIHLALRDIELLRQAIQADPASALRLVQRAQVGDWDSALRAATSMGLTEERFSQSGGGAIGLFILVLVAAVVLVTPKLNVGAERETPPASGHDPPREAPSPPTTTRAPIAS
jgi:hypothetical protein